jgi:hypothetical protein
MKVAELVELLKLAPQDLDVVIEHDYFFQEVEEQNICVVDAGESAGVFLSTADYINHLGFRDGFGETWTERIKTSEGITPRYIRPLNAGRAA